MSKIAKFKFQLKFSSRKVPTLVIPDSVVESPVHTRRPGFVQSFFEFGEEMFGSIGFWEI